MSLDGHLIRSPDTPGRLARDLNDNLRSPGRCRGPAVDPEVGTCQTFTGRPTAVTIEVRTPRWSVPPVLRPGQKISFELRAAEETGEGLMRWAPDGRNIVAKWDFVVEND